MKHLEIITEYMEKPIEGVGQPVFLFPRAVLEELDTLSSHMDTKNLECVKKAVMFLEHAILSTQSRIMFESYEEVSVFCCSLQRCQYSSTFRWTPCMMSSHLQVRTMLSGVAGVTNTS